MSILTEESPLIAPQFIVGFQNIDDRKPGVIIGATTSLTSVGLVTFPSRAFQGNSFELEAICACRCVTATTFRAVLVIDGAVTVFDATQTPGFGTTQFEMIVKLSKLFPGGLSVRFRLSFDMVEASGGTPAQERFSSFFISPASTFDVPPSDNHSIDFQLAKGAAGDTLQSLYTIAKVI